MTFRKEQTKAQIEYAVNQSEHLNPEFSLYILR